MATLRTTSESPAWIPVGDMFKPGTGGFYLISRVPTLADRPRPKGLFDIKFGKRDIEVSEVLSLPKNTFQTLITHDQRNRLKGMMEEALISPHGLFLARVFDRGEYPVSLRREPEIKEAVEEAIEGIPVRNSEKTFKAHYFDNGPISLIETVRRSGFDKTTVQLIEGRSFRLLRQRDRDGVLVGHLALPTHSIGRGFVDVEMEKDLPVANGPINLSEKAAGEIAGRDPMFAIPTYNSTEVMRLDLDRFLISRSTKGEIDDELKRVLATPILDSASLEVVESEEVVVNNLLSGLTLTDQQLARAHTLQIDLEFTARTANFLRRIVKVTTGTELLSRSLDELFSYKGQFGPGAFNEVVGVLKRSLGISDEDLTQWREQNDPFNKSKKVKIEKLVQEKSPAPEPIEEPSPRYTEAVKLTLPSEVIAEDILQLQKRFPSLLRVPS